MLVADVLKAALPDVCEVLPSKAFAFALESPKFVPAPFAI
jgi:hypothetical protein